MKSLADESCHANSHLQYFFLFIEVEPEKKKKCIISPNISPDYFYVIAVFSSWAESLNPKNRLHFGAVDRKRKGMMRALGISIQDSSYPLFLLKKKVKSKRDGKMVFFSKPIS